jgi:ABC-2 type transport system ATP-binding protein
LIETTNLTKTFGRLAAVQSLNLVVQTGELYGFLGPNGAGKTTTIRMLIGLLRPTAGRAIVAGYDIQQDSLNARRKIGYLAQSPTLYEKLSGREFLRFVGGLYGLDDEQVDDQAERLLGLVDLTSKADQLIESYSGGMRKKLGLCGALVHSPKVLVLDEPLAGLDPRSARHIRDTLHALTDQGTTVFLSTPILEVAERVCDRVGILDHGQLITSGSVEDLRTWARRTDETTLEDLFLQLTSTDKATEMITALL